jgi:hypothetical protein
MEASAEVARKDKKAKGAGGSAAAEETEGAAAEGDVNRQKILLALGRWGESHRADDEPLPGLRGTSRLQEGSPGAERQGGPCYRDQGSIP